MAARLHLRRTFSLLFGRRRPLRVPPDPPGALKYGRLPSWSRRCFCGSFTETLEVSLNRNPDVWRMETVAQMKSPRGDYIMKRRVTVATGWSSAFSGVLWPSESRQVPRRLITADGNRARGAHGAAEAPRAGSPFNWGEDKHTVGGFKSSTQKLPFSRENTQKSTRAHFRSKA